MRQTKVTCRAVVAPRSPSSRSPSLATVNIQNTTKAVPSKNLSRQQQIEGEITLVSGKSDILFRPETGTFFAFLQVTGAACEHAAKINVSGQQLCEDEDLETELLIHLLTCSFAGSELKNGTKKAEFSLEESIVLLDHNGDEFAILNNLL